MEPIPETWEAIEEFGPFLMDVDLLQELRHIGSRVRGIVPECVGLSLAYNELGVTFTLVATDVVTAGLDGLQYLDDGPCVEAVEERRTVEFSNEDVLDETSWQLFSGGTAAAGIASTLTLPIMSGEVAIGSVNLYASSATAFSGKLDEVAEVLGGWAPGAIANADLSFATRRTAEEAPRILLDQARIEVAVGILVASHGISPSEARTRLRDAAARAGISETEMARVVVEQATATTASDDEAVSSDGRAHEETDQPDGDDQAS